MTALPTGIVTFLFTDIEGSTRLLEARPEAYRAALARHDAIVQHAVDPHGGVIFQHRGDGFSAAFASPAEGTLAALDAQRALQAEPWDDSVQIRARMGLHTGEVSLQNGEYFGSPLNRCARLMDSAHGGQVVDGDLRHLRLAHVGGHLDVRDRHARDARILQIREDGHADHLANRFGHPQPAVLERLRAVGLSRTDRDGRIEVISDGRKLWVRRSK